MGTSTIVKGANFSASSVVNVYYPFYPDLIGARFYGSDVVGGTAAKKSSVIGPITSGQAAGAMAIEPYAVVPRDTQQFDGEIAIPPRRGTIINLRTLYGNVNAGYKKIGGTEPLSNTGAQAGNFSLHDYAFNNILGQAQLSAAGRALSVGIQADTNIPQSVLSFLAYDADAKTVSYEIWVNGSVSRDTTTFEGPFTVRNMRMENNFGETAGVRHRHFAILGVPLTQEQRATAAAWIRRYYNNRGIPAG